MSRSGQSGTGDLQPIGDTVVQFSGDVSNSVTVKSLGKVVDGAQDPVTYGFMYKPFETVPVKHSNFLGRIFGATEKDIPTKDSKTRPALFLEVFKQSGSNTVAVADAVKAKVAKINEELKSMDGHPRLDIVSDYSITIRNNVNDVRNTILFGILLAIITVYLFLGNLRSTLITGLSIPVSLLGAFILMHLFNFTINLMTLMALSLAVGLLIDDAIVIQENIFRKRDGHFMVMNLSVPKWCRIFSGDLSFR